MPAPVGFEKLPPDVRCRCIKLWQEADGSFWCCRAQRIAPDPDAAALQTAERLYERFCSDLLRDAGMARTRLIAGIQVALRDQIRLSK